MPTYLLRIDAGVSPPWLDVVGTVLVAYRYPDCFRERDHERCRRCGKTWGEHVWQLLRGGRPVLCSVADRVPTTS